MPSSSRSMACHHQHLGPRQLPDGNWQRSRPEERAECREPSEWRRYAEGGATRPCSMAVVAISTRLVAPSLPLMFATWTAAVLLLMKSASAIWPSDRPAATSVNTSRSRGVRS